MRNSFLPLAFVLLVLTGCATRFENAPLIERETNEERRALDVTHKDSPTILMAFSGGGIRATTLSWAVLSDLNRFTYKSQGSPRRLIDDVAMVSSASGGSVTAAYFGLKGADGLKDMEEAFIAQDNMGPLLLDVANPFLWIDLAATGSARSTRVAEMFDEKLFHNATLADLNQKNRPFVLLNATDMVSGEIFPFTPKRFDDICSNLDAFPVSVAVAASAAVPVALSPVALQNYSVDHCQGRSVPPWIRVPLKDRYGAFTNLEEYKRARYANDLRRGPYLFRDIQYLYLVDGGLADNLGLRSLQQAVSSTNGIGDLLYRINTGDIQKLVVIVVNARSDAPSPIYRSSSRPGVLDMIGSVISVPIDRSTSGSSEQMDSLLTNIKEIAYASSDKAKYKKLKVYGIQIDFDQMPTTTEAERALRDKVKEIPTSWTISPEDRETIKEVGPRLLRNNPCFQRLLMDMNIEAPFIDPSIARTKCPFRL